MDIDNIIDRVYKKYCGVYRIMDSNHFIIAEFPASKSEKAPFDPEILIKNKWTIAETGIDVRKCDTINFITKHFWTCKCKHTFIRHIGNAICKKCGAHIKSTPSRLPILNLEQISDCFDELGTIH